MCLFNCTNLLHRTLAQTTPHSYRVQLSAAPALNLGELNFNHIGLRVGFLAAVAAAAPPIAIDHKINITQSLE